jgi:hypothetical protein
VGSGTGGGGGVDAASRRRIGGRSGSRAPAPQVPPASPGWAREPPPHSPSPHTGHHSFCFVLFLRVKDDCCRRATVSCVNPGKFPRRHSLFFKAPLGDPAPRLRDAVFVPKEKCPLRVYLCLCERACVLRRGGEPVTPSTLRAYSEFRGAAPFFLANT